MTRPIVGSWTERYYRSIEQLTAKDESLGWPLLTYLGAIGGVTHQDIDDLVKDQPDGTPGWGVILDPVRCPAYALPWLGQMVGVVVDPNLSVANQRLQVIAVGGWYRGSPNSLINAAKPYLSGTKYVALVERYTGDAYQVLFVTHSAETPVDPTAMRNAVIAQKPAGIVITFQDYLGQTYAQLKASTHTTYTLVKSFYANYDLVRRG